MIIIGAILLVLGLFELMPSKLLLPNTPTLAWWLSLIIAFIGFYLIERGYKQNKQKSKNKE